jgi:hypothetical protein
MPTAAPTAARATWRLPEISARIGSVDIVVMY